MTSGAAVTASPSVRLPRQDILLISAIVLIGVVSARTVSELLIVPSAIVAMAVLRSARRAANAEGVVGEQRPTRNLPRELDRVVAATLTELSDSEARLLLAAIVQHADLLFAQRESAFDAAQDHGTHDHVAELVTAACATALELANLDSTRTSVGAVMGTPTSAQLELTGRLERARTLMASRLTDASDALHALYVSGVERGTPASDRVAELATELRGDAKARGTALAELQALLDTSLQRRASRDRD